MRHIWFVLIGFACSCSSPTAGDRASQIGTISGYHEDDPFIEVELVGNAIRVSVVTFVPGPGCFVRGETRVIVEGQRAEVTPYNIPIGPSGRDCPRGLEHIEHVAEFSFSGSEGGEVVINGRRATGQSPFSEPIQVTIPIPGP